ncbi:MFS transporter, CP family, cyanate transporter [Mesobacillus persicus]|uniref:MFS transporter, CP family, cyanate transporter n=1 Tax=Mesobacillus persicus TaxID=930146 RepID=A0A1H8JBS7_9BACI|nr:MFS transporter [Mesobacillus persicus]SEN78061.1 MFS transporter, CP family, cyanate transporter [Mesobacillus persicus]
MKDSIYRGKWLLIIGIIFVAFNLRPAITSVGPLVGFIREDTGVSNSLAGLLTTLPLLAFALISPFAPKIASRFGTERSIFIGLCLLGVGILIRSIGLLFPIYLGTILVGLGIAICNVLLPGLVKQNFPGKVGLLTGSYTFSMAIWAGLAPGLSVPLASTLDLGWQMSLAVWVLLLFTAILIWVPQIQRNKKELIKTKLKTPSASLWSSPIAWQVTFFMGLQSMIYFSLTAWLPEIVHSQGISIATAGWMVSLMQFSGLPANFLIPILADRLPNQKGIALGIGLFCLTGLLGLLSGGNTLVLTVSIILIGIALGAAISHALTLISLRASNHSQASELSGMAQSVGYMLASIGPFILGYLYDLYANWTFPLILLAIVTILFTFAGIGAGRNQYVLQENKEAISTNSL